MTLDPIVRVALRTGVVNGNYVWMSQARSGESLSAESFDEGVVLCEVLVQDLYGDGPGEHVVACAPNLGHAPACNAFLEGVALGKSDRVARHPQTLLNI